MLSTKTDKVKKAICAGDFKLALKMAKDFRIKITKEQRAAMQRAYECMVHPNFYKELGYEVETTIEHGKNVLVGLYG